VRGPGAGSFGACAPPGLHGQRRAGRRRKRRERSAAFEASAGPPDELPPDPVSEARDRARAKARFVRDLLEYVVVVGLLAVFLRPVAWVVGIVWGIGLAGDFARRIVEPALRGRWVEREVRHALGHAVPAERREIEDRHARRIEALAAGVAHEIRNPITAAKSLVQQMGEDPASRDNVEYAKVALDELARVERSISHLLRYAREEEPRLVRCDLEEVVEATLETLRERLRDAGVEVQLDLGSRGPLRGDPEQLRRVLLNLVGNAADALAGAGTRQPRIAIESGDNLAGTEVWLRVRDNGPGVPEPLRRQLFQPFATGKPGGTGLGLALVKKVLEGHGGSIELESASGGGTSFLLTLPRDGGCAEERT